MAPAGRPGALDLNPDFLDLLHALLDEKAEFLIVGAHALAVHGPARTTGDIDIWIRASPQNAERVWKALLEFGAPVESLGIEEEDFSSADRVCQIGVPPRRIDILTTISGVEFEEAWTHREIRRQSGLELPFLGRDEFRRNKEASGRPKDLADLALLAESEDAL